MVLGLVLATGLLYPALAATPASDPRAVAVAQATLEAMGGQEAWDATRFVTWNFFGQRKHVWDKWTGDVRIEARTRDGASIVVLMNVNSRRGRAWKDGAEAQAVGDLPKLLEAGYAWWINDSYWLVMPYKLRDPGVVLKSMGERAMADGRMADCLELTFDGVGLTPENRYLVYVSHDSALIEQWDFFERAADEQPGFQIPWHGWTRHGRIMLSGDRGEHRLSEIAVYDALPAEVFTSPGAVTLP